MSETTQVELRKTIDWMKADSGTGTKARKQNRFRAIYTENVAHIVAGERYDDAGVGPATARGAVKKVYPELDLNNYDTVSEALTTVEGGSEESLDRLVSDLDSVARRSGTSQKEYVGVCLERHSQPDLVTLALLDDESIGLGKSQMKDSFFDGSRDERKRAEAFTDSTAEFITLAQEGELPMSPTVGEPFNPMLAASEGRGEPEHPVAQMKIDGNRVLTHVKNGEATAFSRQENDVTESLPELSEIEFPDGDYILDGEVISENNSFSEVSERMGRKAENVERDVEMHFKIFDCIVYQGDDVTDSDLEDRFNMAMEVVGACDDERFNILPLYSDVEVAKDRAMENDYEGVIVKNNRSEYEFKRSSEWQKCKYDDETCDVVISGFNEGTGEASNTLGAVEIESADGVSLGKSGSGFDDEQRDDIWNNQENWLGETIEIEARGLGSESKLRMPIYVRHRSDDGEPDSFERVQEIMPDV